MAVAQYLLTFREVLEAAILTAIILAFLVKTGRNSLTRFAWYGVCGATVASFGLGGGILLLYGSLSETSKVLFEGVAALLAVGVLTSMISWMALRGRYIRQYVEGRVEAAVTHGAIFGLVSLTFILVLREGLETVLFLTPFMVTDTMGTVMGGFLGLGAGVALAYGIFRLGLKLDLRRFFYFTSILLILLAGGLFGYGIHELLEYAEASGSDLGWWGQAAYSLAIARESPLHHKGFVGSIFAVMFGYTAQAEWARVVGHVAYLAVALPLIFAVYKRPEWVKATMERLRALARPAPARLAGPQQEE